MRRTITKTPRSTSPPGAPPSQFVPRGVAAPRQPEDAPRTPIIKTARGAQARAVEAEGEELARELSGTPTSRRHGTYHRVAVDLGACIRRRRRCLVPTRNFREGISVYRSPMNIRTPPGRLASDPQNISGFVCLTNSFTIVK